MKLESLGDLFLHELKDIYDAEHQLVEALPKMARNASNPELKAAFTKHLEETRGHVVRLKEVFQEYGEEPSRETCAGMKGLIAEGEKLLKEDAEPEVSDAGLIGAAQRVEHYEMAVYGTLRTWATQLGNEQIAMLLEETFAEEEAADQKLSEIAESSVNEEAAEEDTNDEADESEMSESDPEARRRSKTQSSSTTASRSGRSPRSRSKRSRR
jgi:ferritin-like metal-binding protein YciE